MGGQALLSVRGLTRDFRGFRAVAGVDLDIAAGTVHALVGPNGAGKTTLFNLLTGFLRPTAGRIELDGRDVTGLSPERVAQLGVARSFQITSLFPQLSGREHVELALQSPSGLGWRFWRSAKLMRRYSDRARELLDMVGLAEVAEVPADALAYGRKRALELAIALALDPKVLLLDEPTAGMGLEDVDRTVELIQRVRAGRTVVMVEHNMSVVGRLADRVSVLQAGRILVEGPYEEVRSDERVITAYLGTAQVEGPAVEAGTAVTVEESDDAAR
jgi:branched-chain amino acid transport system ATP-binding protein